MSDGAQPRVLAIMGSGETSPTMVTIHKTLAERLAQGHRNAILLDTPYAFQENAAGHLLAVAGLLRQERRLAGSGRQRHRPEPCDRAASR